MIVHDGAGTCDTEGREGPVTDRPARAAAPEEPVEASAGFGGGTYDGRHG